MATRMVKLTFQAPVHFGDGRLSDGEYTCDAATLFSALFIEALKAGCADELLVAAKSGGFSISDAFPYIGERLYIPKPMARVSERATNGMESGDSRARKANKALKYIPADKLGDFLSGSFDFVGELERFNNGVSFLRTKVNLTRSTSEDAEPYHVGGYRFAPECGLFFLVGGTYDVRPLMEQLSYSGIGGKRSSGYGRFTFEVREDAPLHLVDGSSFGERAMLLTSAFPREAELTDSLLEGARYHLVRKGGFVQSTSHAPTPRKKRSLCLFAPGSVFERCFEGDVLDVNATPGAHPVYRYARAMWMEV
ncbi:type III-A CRISPR-associated RAMP protein Csm4 [Senegalimassilia anaerobia]